MDFCPFYFECINKQCRVPFRNDRQQSHLREGDATIPERAGKNGRTLMPPPPTPTDLSLPPALSSVEDPLKQGTAFLARGLWISQGRGRLPRTVPMNHSPRPIRGGLLSWQVFVTGGANARHRPIAPVGPRPPARDFRWLFPDLRSQTFTVLPKSISGRFERRPATVAIVQCESETERGNANEHSRGNQKHGDTVFFGH